MKTLSGFKNTMLAVGAAVVAIPGFTALDDSLTPPPNHPYFFGLKFIACAAILLFLYQRSLVLQRIPRRTINRWVLSATVLFVASLIPYIYYSSKCIIHHPVRGAAFFPLQLNGPIADMVRDHGGRYGAIDYYGIAAVEQKIQLVYGSSPFITTMLFLILYIAMFASLVTIFGLLGFSAASDDPASSETKI